MSGPVIQVEAWVLNKRPPAESFQTFTIFSGTLGTTLALQRISRKASTVTLDIFDQASLLLEVPQQGQTTFVKEARVLNRPTQIGRSYETLLFASRFTHLVARNPVGEESRDGVYSLLGQAIASFAAAARPDVVYFKSLYRFCRDEGYPLKQAWLSSLSANDRAAASTLLNRPVAEQSADVKTVARLQKKMDDFLRGETEIQLE